MTRSSLVLSWLAVALAAAAAGLGLFVPGIYRDPPAMIPALRGQDLITLATLPVLLISALAARRGSLRGILVALGVLGYLLYTAVGMAMAYTFNSLFIVYIGLLSVTAFALAGTLAGSDIATIAAGFGRSIPRRTLSVFLVVMAGMVALPELLQLWNAYRSGSVPEIVARSGASTSFVHALDLGFVAPLSVLAGIFLWSRRTSGYLLAAIMLVKAATMGFALLSMTWFSARAGYPIEVGLTSCLWSRRRRRARGYFLAARTGIDNAPPYWQECLPMKRTIIGFGLAALIFGLLYDVTQILDVAGVFPVPWGLFAIVLPSIFLAWSYAGLVSALHARSGERTRHWTQLALTFATIYAGLNTIVYPVQLAVIVPQALSGGDGLASPFAMTAGQPLTAVNAAAYALLSLSCFLLSFAYAGQAGGKLARGALIAHGALAPIILAILYIPAILPVGGLWIVTFPLAMVGVLRFEMSRNSTV